MIRDHQKTTLISLGGVIVYMYEDHGWIESILPAKGKPLAIMTLISVVFLFEFFSNWMRKSDVNMSIIDNRLQVQALKQDVNRIYDKFILSGDDFIDHEFTIREISELEDTRKLLGVNSYTQNTLRYLSSKIRHNHKD